MTNCDPFFGRSFKCTCCGMSAKKRAENEKHVSINTMPHLDKRCYCDEINGIDRKHVHHYHACIEIKLPVYCMFYYFYKTQYKSFCINHPVFTLEFKGGENTFTTLVDVSIPKHKLCEEEFIVFLIVQDSYEKLNAKYKLIATETILVSIQ